MDKGINSSTKQVSAVMIITAASKCLGFLRDIIIANYYGTGIVADAYYVAQVIPELLFSLIVQAISVGFIPIYVEIVHKKRIDDADRFTNNVIKICLILCCALVCVVNLFPREIVKLFAYGFDTEAAALTVKFTRIAILAMFFRIVVSVYSSYLHANREFVLPAFNGIVLDVVMITAVIVSFYTRTVILVWGMVAAAFLQFVMLRQSVKKRKARMTWSLKGIFDDDVKQLVKLLLPVIIGVGVNQINVLADRTMASSIPGAISSLNYASKVDNVLENIIILSLATVVFPSFSKDTAAGDTESFKKDIYKSLDIVSITMIPCSILAFAFSDQVIQLLFGRGAFDLSSIVSSSNAMKYYSVGLLFLSYNAIMTRAFYALKKVSIVSYVTCGTVLVNIAMNFLLKPVMGIGGLALATSISNIATSILLFALFNKEINRAGYKAIIPELYKTVIASLIMTVISLGIYNALHVGMGSIISMLIAAFTGGICFILVEVILKSELMHSFIYSIFGKLKTYGRFKS